MNEAREKLDSLKKDPTIGQFVEYVKKYKYYLIGALSLLLIVQACGGGLPEPHQKYVGEWKFVRTDAKDGFFWAEKDLKALTLDGNGTWDLDGDKAYGDWGMDDERWEDLIANLESARERGQAEHYGITDSELEERVLREPKLFFREESWNCNNSSRVDHLDARVETDADGKETLVLDIYYRAFLNQIVDEGNGAELANRLSITSQKYYFER